MTTETVRVDWVADDVFLLRDRNQFPIVMTQPQGVNGSDLLPLSLIGCSAWDVVSILRQQGQEVTDLKVLAHSERDAEPPWRFLAIQIVYHFTGRNLDEASVQRAIELSETKYCSIYATLRATVDLRSSYEITQLEP